jgi:hypothetical protein
LKPFSTLEEARNAVLDGDAWGVVSMTSNFSSALLERMFNMMEADAATRNQSKINVSFQKSSFPAIFTDVIVAIT